MLVRRSIRGKAYAAKSHCPSQVEKRYVTVRNDTVKWRRAFWLMSVCGSTQQRTKIG
jgi:hypothetical protein